jgi:AraC-like DNA-binding protein
MNQREADLERQRMQIGREEMVARMSRIFPEDRVLEAFPGFFVGRLSKVDEARHVIYEPSFCFIVQGAKRMLLGEEVYRYDPQHYLVFAVDLPVVFHIEDASEEKPYFGFTLNLDPKLVASVIAESGIEIKKGDATAKGINVSPVDANLVDAALRLIRLLDTPREGEILLPLITREIVYHLLLRGEGARLSHTMASTGDTRRISRAIKQLRENFDEPLKIENIARELGMSVSGFHHHFKSVTAMSPLQYQKQVRLQEARRLMLGEDLDVANAGLRVGYEDPAYFSREYKKMFGEPPQRDIARLRHNLEV